jgi:hypothetical protein
MGMLRHLFGPFFLLSFGIGLAIIYLEGRTVFRPGLPVVVDVGGGDVGMAEPFLDLGGRSLFLIKSVIKN